MKLKSKHCPKCKESKALTEFTAYETGRLYIVCKECHAKMDKGE